MEWCNGLQQVHHGYGHPNEIFLMRAYLNHQTHGILWKNMCIFLSPTNISAFQFSIPFMGWWTHKFSRDWWFSARNQKKSWHNTEVTGHLIRWKLGCQQSRGGTACRGLGASVDSRLQGDEDEWPGSPELVGRKMVPGIFGLARFFWFGIASLLKLAKIE